MRFRAVALLAGSASGPSLALLAGSRSHLGPEAPPRVDVSDAKPVPPHLADGAMGPINASEIRTAHAAAVQTGGGLDTSHPPSTAEAAHATSMLPSPEPDHARPPMPAPSTASPPPLPALRGGQQEAGKKRKGGHRDDKKVSKQQQTGGQQEKRAGGHDRQAGKPAKKAGGQQEKQKGTQHKKAIKQAGKHAGKASGQQEGHTKGQQERTSERVVHNISDSVGPKLNASDKGPVVHNVSESEGVIHNISQPESSAHNISTIEAIRPAKPMQATKPLSLSPAEGKPQVYDDPFSPFPPPPPDPPPTPPLPPPDVEGKDVNMTFRLTGDPSVDEPHMAAIEERRLTSKFFELPAAVLGVVCIMFIAEVVVYRLIKQTTCRLILCCFCYVLYGAVSVIFNKLALTVLPSPSVLLTLQISLTLFGLLVYLALAACCRCISSASDESPSSSIEVACGSIVDVLRWLPVGLVGVSAMFAWLYGLFYATVGAVVTWRNVAPIPLMLAECMCFARARHRTSCCAIFGLLTIVVGIGIYGYIDPQFSLLGTGLIVAHALLAVIESLLRQTLTTSSSPLHLSFTSRLLVQYISGLVVAASVAVPLGAIDEVREAIPHIGIVEATYIAGSVVVSAILNYTTLQLSALISATKMVLAANVSKALVIAFGMGFLFDDSSPLAIVGASLALIGNVMYYAARFDMMESNELLPDTTKSGSKGDKSYTR